MCYFKFLFLTVLMYQCLITCLNGQKSIDDMRPINEAINSFSTYQIGVVKRLDTAPEGEGVAASRLEQENPLEKISIQLEFKQQVFVADLTLNRKLLSKDFIQKSVSKTGQYFHDVDQKQLECYYSGSVRNIEDSLAAFCICQGIEGLFTTENETYITEPLREQNTVYEQYVVVYRQSDSTTAPGKCGVDGAVIEQDPIGRNKRKKRFSERQHDHFNHLHHHKLSKRAALYPWPQDTDGVSLALELYLVNSFSEFVALNRSINNVFLRSYGIANVVNTLYQPVNITVILVGLEVWTQGDLITITTNSSATLDQFCRYRSSNINPTRRNDVAHLITTVQFANGVIGLAWIGTMCSTRLSCGINSDFRNLYTYVATTMTHEMGHNFGLLHDDAYPNQCQCNDPAGHCIMWPSISNTINWSQWSQCSLDSFNQSLRNGLDVCLRNSPEPLFNVSVCGNGLVEPGEQCDCGSFSQSICNRSCCDASTCRLIGNAACASGRCCNIGTCQILSGSSQCRQAAGPCDVPEYCDGVSALCPDNVVVYNGTSCSAVNTQAYCFNGQCRPHLSQCQLIWGTSSQVSNSICYSFLNVRGDNYGNCGLNASNSNSYITCNINDILCGTLHCTAQNSSAVYAPKLLRYLIPVSLDYDTGESIQCYAVEYEVGMGVQDPGLVPNGANCGTDKMCLNQKCVDVSTVYTTTCTTATCNGRGICNSLGQCHCDPGYSPPFCDRPGCGGSTYSSPSCSTTALTTTPSTITTTTARTTTPTTSTSTTTTTTTTRVTSTSTSTSTSTTPSTTTTTTTIPQTAITTTTTTPTTTSTSTSTSTTTAGAPTTPTSTSTTTPPTTTTTTAPQTSTTSTTTTTTPTTSTSTSTTTTTTTVPSTSTSTSTTTPTTTTTTTTPQTSTKTSTTTTTPTTSTSTTTTTTRVPSTSTSTLTTTPSTTTTSTTTPHTSTTTSTTTTPTTSTSTSTTTITTRAFPTSTTSTSSTTSTPLTSTTTSTTSSTSRTTSTSPSALTTTAALCNATWSSPFLNTNVFGGTFFSSARSLSACQAACVSISGCTGIDWDPSNPNQLSCFLILSNATGIRQTGGAPGVTHYDYLGTICSATTSTTATSSAAFPSVTSTTSTRTSSTASSTSTSTSTLTTNTALCNATWSSPFLNTNVFGGTVFSSARSLSACQAACVSISGCTGIDWDPSNPNQLSCFLILSNATGIRQTGGAPGVTHYDYLGTNCSVRQTCNFTWSVPFANTNVLGGTAIPTASSVDECQAACAANSSCSGIDFNPNNRDAACFLTFPYLTARNSGTAPGITHYDLLSRTCS